MKEHKKKRRRKRPRNRRTFRQFLSQCWVNIKKFFKALFFLVLLFTFFGVCCYIVVAISNREFTVYLALAFVISFILSYILGHIISKKKDLDFSGGGSEDAIIVMILLFILIGGIYLGVKYIIHKITGNEKVKPF
ncbi:MULTISPECIES: permease [unclassified Bacillus (in: firmicutes)]|uniref:permease n=1 Tax=unclassified Bacillus (in: firmicutes) TaxID=185979 RepID=UPI0008F3EA90|nr:MULTISPECIES: permease [unclassified Bacillus (in: firmicutes)]SFJ59026.1 hypothetical protein SAMN04488574_11834 [Bacillus sp. 71mf]SFS68705.1 hypothetical protein SAMN04488145_102490 [Bacillus sp. 103mf]